MSEYHDQWLKEHVGGYVRRRMGSTVYRVLRYGPNPEGSYFVILERVRPEGRTITWAPLTDIPKFVKVDAQGKPIRKEQAVNEKTEATYPEEQTSASRVIQHLAYRYSEEELLEAIRVRKEKEDRDAATLARQQAEKEAREDDIELAIATLRAAARSGDTAAAEKLLQVHAN